MAFSAAEDVRTADSRRHGPKFKNPTSRAGRRDESPDVGMGGPKSLRLKNIYNINCIHEFSISPNREYFLILNFFGVRRVLEQYPGSERRAAPRFYTHQRRTSC